MEGLSFLFVFLLLFVSRCASTWSKTDELIEPERYIDINIEEPFYIEKYTVECQSLGYTNCWIYLMTPSQFKDYEKDFTRRYLLFRTTNSSVSFEVKNYRHSYHFVLENHGYQVVTSTIKYEGKNSFVWSVVGIVIGCFLSSAMTALCLLFIFCSALGIFSLSVIIVVCVAYGMHHNSKNEEVVKKIKSKDYQNLNIQEESEYGAINEAEDSYIVTSN